MLRDTLCLQYNASFAVTAVFGLVAGMLKGVVTIFLIFLQVPSHKLVPVAKRVGGKPLQSSAQALLPRRTHS